jgi:four helix bundle protein
MGEQNGMLQRRIADFAAAVLRFVRRLPGKLAADAIVGHLARSAAGISANYRAASLARSRQDVIAAARIALEQAEETDRWLWMAMQLNVGNAQEITMLAREARELRTALTAYVSAARARPETSGRKRR